MYWNKKICALALAILVSLTGCGHQQTIPTLKEQKENTLVDYKVETKNLKDVTYVQGYVAAKQYEQRFVKEGAIEEINVSSGEKVKKGQLIATLECKEEKNKVEDQYKEIAYHTKMSSLAIQQLKLDIKLKQQEIETLEKKNVPRKTIQLAKIELSELKETLDYEAKKAQLQNKQDEKILSQLQNHLNENYLYASHSGTVSFTLTTYTGTYAEANQTVVAIASDNEFYIEPNSVISDVEAAKIKEAVGYVNGQQVKLQYEVVSTLQDGTAKKRTIFPIINGKDDMLGFTAVAGIIKDKVKNAVVVSEQALNKGVDGYYVYVKTHNGKEKVPVTLGKSMNGYVELTSGVEAGQTVLGYAGLFITGKTEEEKVSLGNMSETLEIINDEKSCVEVGRVIKKYVINEEEGCTLVKYYVSEGTHVNAGDKLYEIKYPDSGTSSFEDEASLMQLKKEFKRNQDSLMETISSFKKHDLQSRIGKEKAELQLEQVKLQYDYDLKQLQDKINEGAVKRENKIIYASVGGVISSTGEKKKGESLSQGSFMAAIAGSTGNIARWFLTQWNNGWVEDPLFDEPVDKDDVQKNFERMHYGLPVAFYQGNKKIKGRIYTTWSDAEQYSAYDSNGQGPSHVFRTVNNEKLSEWDLQKVTVTTYRIKKGIIIANKFINHEEDRSFVWVKVNDSIQKRYIAVGIKKKGKSWVIDGLTEGETIVRNTEV